MLAERLGVPFIELDRLIEQDYGARIPDLVEIAGLATFRRFERACLERVIAEHAAAVIATAGGIVSSPETYGLLLRRTHTVWIKARPEEHMRRVMAQGDFRPMAQNREAMADLVAILDARSADYGARRGRARHLGRCGAGKFRETDAARDALCRAAAGDVMTLADQGFLDLGGMRLEYRMIGPRPQDAPTIVCCTKGSAASDCGTSFRTSSQPRPAPACSSIRARATASRRPLPCRVR